MSPAEEYRKLAKDVKGAVVQIAKDTLGVKCKVINRLVFERNKDKFGGQLRCKDDGNRIHALNVRYNGNTFVDAGLSKITASVTPLLPLELIFFHWHELGTDESNTEEQIMDDIMMLTWALGARPNLGVSCVEAHYNLRTGPILPDVIGEEPILYAQSQLVVRLMSRQIKGKV